jgi:hypothetical protein
MTTKKDKVTVDLTVPAKLEGPPRLAGMLLTDLDAPVTTFARAQQVKEWLDAAKAEEKRRVEYFQQLKAPLADLRARILEKEREALEPVRRVVQALSAKLLEWRETEARARREEEARRRAEAEARAAEERARQLAALEEARKATASRIEKKALKVTAASLAAAPLVAQPPPPVPPAPQLAGVYERESWKAEVVDFPALVVAAAVPVLRQIATEMSLTAVDRAVITAFLDDVASEGTATLDTLQPNQSRLNGLATECRADLPVPGVVSRRVTTLVSRAVSG